jgi:hypothetical protein
VKFSNPIPQGGHLSSVHYLSIGAQSPSCRGLAEIT